MRGGGKKRVANAGPPPAPVIAGRSAAHSHVAGTAPAFATRATLSGSVGTFTVLQGSEMRAGRDASQCAIVVADSRVSSVHAVLKMEGGHLQVRDEGSNNGTFVDGAPAPRGVWTTVRHGGALRFGAVEFAVRLE
jgi:pSer/pThr/pTyr-binding forkhead associated (FHA) protein